MSIGRAAMIVAISFSLFSLAVADEPVKLPEPLQEVTLDLGLLNDHFTVVDCQLYESGEFYTFGSPSRVIAEQTLVWTLEATAALPGRQARRLFEEPAFPRARFYSSEGDQDQAADARSQGYFLVTDRRWLKADLPSIAKGDRITVYVTIGKTGAADLLAKGASKVVFEAARERSRRRIDECLSRSQDTR